MQAALLIFHIMTTTTFQHSISAIFQNFAHQSQHTTTRGPSIYYVHKFLDFSDPPIPYGLCRNKYRAKRQQNWPLSRPTHPTSPSSDVIYGWSPSQKVKSRGRQIVGNIQKTKLHLHKRHCIKFIYSEKAKKFCEIFTLLLSYVVPVKCKVNILQNFVAFSEYMNLTYIAPCWLNIWLETKHITIQKLSNSVPYFHQLLGIHS